MKELFIPEEITAAYYPTAHEQWQDYIELDAGLY